MNDCPKQRYASANAFQGRIQEQPLSQDSFCDDSTDGQSLSPSSQAASIYEGTTKGSTVSEIAPTQKQPSSAISKPTSNTENWSTSLQAVLEQPPSTLPQKLLLGGIAFCVAFGAWAWLGKIEQVGYAQGQLVPKGQVYKIDPVDSGKITRIAVKEGEKVKAGQVLVEIDTQLAASEVERLQQMLTADRMQFNQMQALLERIRLEAETRVAIADADLQAQNAAISETKEKVATLQHKSF
ncbi:MAG: hypothetical protein N4J56_003162 [Chroococcidiopsis sp. SAG 2025]|uniref:biotin/lipoyl-binding protein n=1 Tax=Chroococcidiopsis sp. SAG 2025 TaxID=171389 RepID=UPI00293701E7|nr:biotin/lipoyl-binding protein [Chroococcidiopsis sp. SAG 2025]MDV2993508.1 hypothetical protein [Chroococcidiopsis sp. SAG 2025]